MTIYNTGRTSHNRTFGEPLPGPLVVRVKYPYTDMASGFRPAPPKKRADMSALLQSWCTSQSHAVGARKSLHVLSEKSGGRAACSQELTKVMAAHYEDPDALISRFQRLGYKNAAKVLKAKLPRQKKARSGHIGEILATESVEFILPSFKAPIRKLRWLDGREMALRGEDVIAIDITAKPVRFLKGESKSGISISANVVETARIALNASNGRPSEHAMVFIQDRLRERQETQLANLFEDYLIRDSVPVNQLVHVNFGLCGNDASSAYRDDLNGYTKRIEQHSIMFRVDGHAEFVKEAFSNLNKYAP